MSRVKVFAFLGLIHYCVCGQKLLVDRIRWKFLELENELWNFEENNLGSIKMPMQEAEEFLAKTFIEFDGNLTEMIGERNLTYEVAPLHRWTSEIKLVYDKLMTIQETYDKYIDYEKQVLLGADSDEFEIVNLIEDTETGPGRVINDIYTELYESNGGILDKQTMMYAFAQSKKEWIYHLYNIISIYDIKVYIMTQFTYVRNHLRDRGDENVKLSASARKMYEDRIETMSKSVIKPNAFTIYAPILFNTRLVAGTNYMTIEKLLEPHIGSEVDISGDSDCTHECNDFRVTKDYGCHGNSPAECSNLPRCNGTLYDCEFIGERGTVCPSTSEDKSFEYVSFSSKIIGNPKQNCNNQVTLKSWTAWFKRCDYCLCFCDNESDEGDRFISLRPAMATEETNSVVTGLRMKLQNGMLYLQIQQGQLTPYGYVNQSTVEWVPFSEINLSDENATLGTDYHKFTYRARRVAVDNLEAPKDDYVVTGVKFNSNFGYVHLNIHVSPFNWDTGKVDYSNGFFVHKEKEGRSVRYQETGKRSPTGINGPWIYRWGIHSYVEFGYSNLNPEGGLNTVPFFDLLPVVSKPAVPLRGASIVFRQPNATYENDFSGFVTLRINPFHYSKLISTELPTMQYRLE